MKRKISIIILLVFILLFINTTISNSTAKPPSSNILELAKAWIDNGINWYKNPKNPLQQSTWSAFGDLASLLFGAAFWIILCVGVCLGIKYMFASVEEKASIKESIKPFVIGSIIILGSLTIWKISVQLLDGLI